MGRKARNTTMKDNIDFDRFINVMADLITKYADKIDLDSLPDPPIEWGSLTEDANASVKVERSEVDIEMPEAETSKVSASFFAFMGKISVKWFWGSKYRNISVFLSKKRLYKRRIES